MSSTLKKSTIEMNC